MPTPHLTTKHFTTLILTLLFTTLSHADKPNIVFILADDMGTGDVQSLNPEGKIATPNIDSLAENGMAFTNAHSTSAVCTPTRYSVLTGRYNWRTHMGRGVLGGYSLPLIKSDEMTVARFLQEQGYATACIGKWHLGMEWQKKDGDFANSSKDAWEVDYAKPITNGPITRGFDYFFGISASLDMPPYVYIENDHSVGVPTVEKEWIRKGPATEDFEAIDVLPKLVEKAVAFIEEQAQDKDKPFFLYMPFPAPHTPILPTPEWQDKSDMNAFADFVMQVDHSVGQVVEALKKNGVLDNTLIIFTTDNGTSPKADFEQLATFGHDPSYVYRGHKADIFEGGHRVPFIVQWPGQIAAGKTSTHPVCQSDFIRTCADILDVKIDDASAVDSFTLLPVLTNTKSDAPLRDYTVHHSINGSFAISQDDWKLILCPDSGGWSDPRPNKEKNADLPPLQLYNLKDDIGETNNLAGQYPEKVASLTATLQDYVSRGRSTPGAIQANDREINILRRVPEQKTNPMENSDPYNVFDYVNGDVYISEIVTKNVSGLSDEDGEISNWVELHNRGENEVSLLNWELIYNNTNWTFPDVIITPNQYMVIFTSGKNRLSGQLHTNFTMSNRDDEYLALRKGPEIEDLVSRHYPLPVNDPNCSYFYAADGVGEGMFEYCFYGFTAFPSPNTHRIISE